MPDTQLTCSDCGDGIDRPNRKGPRPKRCAACRSTFRAATTARWHAEHPDARKRYTAERTARKQAQREPRTCPVCEQQFQPPRTDSTYCSKPCALAAGNTPDLDQARRTLKRRVEARQTAAREPACEWCEAKPKRTDSKSGRPARFCSDRCMRAWHSAVRRDLPSRRHGHGNYEHKQRTAALGLISAGVTWTQWRPILAFYGGRCAYCASPDSIEQDHLVPVTRGGLHEPSNVVPACRRCNRSKGDQLLEEWRPGFVLDRMTA